MQQQRNNNYNFSSFKIIQQLSTSIYLVQHKTTNNLFTLRVLTGATKEPFVSIVESLKHDNIQEFVAQWEERGRWYVLQQWEINGDLKKKLLRQTTFLPENEIWGQALQISLALQQIHKQGIIHRDIKPENIFIGFEGQLKIGDFGIAIYNNQVKIQKDTSQVFPFGTPFYLAPEAIKNQQYNNKIDIWAFGCLIYQMAMLKLPYEGGATLKSLAYNIIFKQNQPLSDQCSVQLRYLISRMLEKDPIKRAEIQEVTQIIQENYHRSSQILDDNIKVSTAQHTRFEGSQLSKMKQNSSSLEVYNVQDIDLIINESEIEEKEQQICEVEDIKLFLQLNQTPPRQASPRVKRTFKRPQTADVSMKTGFFLPQSSRVHKMYPEAKLKDNEFEMKTSQQVQKELFNKISTVRPNSAVNQTSKQYINYSLVKDVQIRRLLQTQPIKIDKISTETTFLKLDHGDNMEMSMDKPRFNKRPLTAPSQFLKVRNIPKESYQSTVEAIRRDPKIQILLSDKYLNEDKEKRRTIKTDSVAWQHRIQSASLLKK